jgi:tetratricopeptide (TPR) repeat protein
MDINYALTTPEKYQAVSTQSSSAEEHTLRQVLTCQFDKLFTLNDESRPKEQLYCDINVLHRVWIEISKRLTAGSFSVDNIHTICEEWLKEGMVEPKRDFTKEETLILSLYALITMFLKENWTGKSYLFVNAEIWYQEERVFKADPEAMEEYSRRINNIHFKNLDQAAQDFITKVGLTEESFDKNTFACYKDKDYMKQYHPTVFTQEMVIGGEDCYRTMKLINYYIIVKRSVDYLLSKELGKKFYYLHLLRGRLSFLHAQIMSYPTETLRETMMANYEKVLTLFDERPQMIENEARALLYIEYSHALLHFYKYQQSEDYLKKAKELLGVEFNFTGKMGVRTKYQSYKVSQLTLEVERKKAANNYDRIEKIESGDKEASLPKIVKLDDIIDNILYEKPIIEHEGEPQELSVYDHILLIGLIRHTQKTSPLDDLQREQVLAYIHQTQSKLYNWSVLVMLLIVRSLVEFPFLKKRERSLLQLHQISDDWNVGKEDTYERQKYLFPLNFPSYIEFQTIIIEKYLNMGMVMTACQIYEQINMLEECVECYFRAGHLDKSKDLAEQLLKEKPSAKLYCILGDIHKDPTMYEKAWEFSGQKYARAQRSLGKYWFNQKDMAKAAHHLKLAVEINDYHIDSWSLLGYVYMTTGKSQEAINAYSKVVQIDNSQCLVWANLSNLYLAIGKKAEALSTIEQAAKLNDNRWKVWVNYAAIAYENQKFSKFVRAILKLLDQDKPEAVDDANLKRLIISLNCTLESVKEKPEEIRQAELLFRE